MIRGDTCLAFGFVRLAQFLPQRVHLLPLLIQLLVPISQLPRQFLLLRAQLSQPAGRAKLSGALPWQAAEAHLLFIDVSELIYSQLALCHGIPQFFSLGLEPALHFIQFLLRNREKSLRV